MEKDYNPKYAPSEPRPQAYEKLSNLVHAGQADLVEKFFNEECGGIMDHPVYNELLLNDAADSGHIEIVKFFVAAGASRSLGKHAMNIAARNGHYDVVRFLYSKGAKIGVDTLISASEGGLLPFVKFIVEDEKSVNVNAEGSLYDTALERACERGHFDVVDYLVGAGAVVTEHDIYAASSKGHLKIVQFLWEKATDDAKCAANCRRPPFNAAAKNGRHEIVEFFVASGVDIDYAAVNDYNVTALIDASSEGHVRCVEALVKGGAKLEEAVTYSGETALIRASTNGNREVVRILVEAGANVNATNRDGDTALIEASRIRLRPYRDIDDYLEIIRILVEAGANKIERALLSAFDDDRIILCLAKAIRHTRDR